MDRGETLAAIEEYRAGRVGPDIAAAFRWSIPGTALAEGDFTRAIPTPEHF